MATVSPAPTRVWCAPPPMLRSLCVSPTRPPRSQMPTDVIIKYTRIANAQLTNVNEQVTKMGGNEIAELNIYDSNFHQREFVKEALDEAGYVWAYHGSQNKGHKNVPPEMKGNIVVDTFVASQERIKAASVWEKKTVNVKFVESKMVQQAWYHPVFMGEFIFGAVGVPFDKICL